MRKFVRASVVSLAIACVALPSAAQEEEQERQRDDTRQIMHRVFEAMEHLLPLSLSARELSDSERADAARWAGVLANAADTLRKHEARQVEASRGLSRSLASDAKVLESSLRSGELVKAQYYILSMTDNCVACHSRLPKTRDFEVGDGLFSAGSTAAMDPRARIRLLVATRQFDAALGAWEAQFADLSLPPESLDHSGALDDYLTVAIRVQQDLARAKRTLERFATRTTLPKYLHERVEYWLQSLTRLLEAPLPDPTLANARSLIERSEGVLEYPNDQRGRIYDLVASSLLHRLIAQPASLSDLELAEALYLLGRIEARGPGGRWISETEIHLERSIRLAPGAPFAGDALTLLEEYTLLEYSGSEGEPIPRDRRELLEDLQVLVDEASGVSPPSHEL